LFVAGEVNWVQCDRCEEWFHLLCVGLAEDEVSEEEEYECFNCKQQRTGATHYPTLHPATGSATAGSKSSSVYGVTLNDVSVIKPELDMDNMLVYNEEVEVGMDGQKSSDSYASAAEGYSRNDTQVMTSKTQTSMSSKVTQFSYNETDDSSQDEVKSSYSVGGLENRDIASMSTQIPTTLVSHNTDSQD